MLRLWFSTPPFCVYSCVTLQAANDGLNLIIMDLVFLRQLLTVCTLYEPFGIWPIRQKGEVNPRSTKHCTVTFWQVLKYLFLQSLLLPPTECSSVKPTISQPSVSLCVRQRMVHRDARCVLQKKKRYNDISLISSCHLKSPTRRQNHKKLWGGLVTCVELDSFIWHKLIRHVHFFQQGHLSLLRFHNLIRHNGNTQAFWHQCQSVTPLCVNLLLLLHDFIQMPSLL